MFRATNSSCFQSTDVDHGRSPNAFFVSDLFVVIPQMTAVFVDYVATGCLGGTEFSLEVPDRSQEGDASQRRTDEDRGEINKLR